MIDLETSCLCLKRAPEFLIFFEGRIKSLEHPSILKLLQLIRNDHRKGMTL